MKTFVVLGMHRSATSLVAMGLFKSNIRIGDTLIGSHESNPYGHFEDADFVEFNDMLLSKAGGSWNNPPMQAAIDELGKMDEMSKKISHFITSKQKAPFWGWKDPRTTLTIRLFHPYLQNPHYFACYRNPIDVAGSLERRGDMSFEKGILLATEYNNRLNSFLKDFYEGRI